MLCQITLTKQNLLNFVLQIGNPLLEFAVNLNSRDEYYWSHGLISDAVYELLTKDCNGSKIWRSAIRGFQSRACTFVMSQLEKELSNFTDPYNVIGDVCLSYSQTQMDMLYQPLNSRFQTFSSLHSHSHVLSQHVKFTHCARTHFTCTYYFFI